MNPEQMNLNLVICCLPFSATQENCFIDINRSSFDSLLRAALMDRSQANQTQLNKQSLGQAVGYWTVTKAL
ncbi:hypothetical protein T07_836 [Trichinella nelsoni]|uniref:Uncharacterized protein n=6 Tax=Trichinella TaxID=6333 RepID=A0A0V1L3D8_9BILA|nr:hypothetical protein T07_836 [Trichinella nelsoni]KRX41225.1 hypothetical protein T05_4509 [Trichinella murrelli]KRX68094.1 hypothetical protein T09_3888 [Trichinella sp. T9]KRX80521.1 hypothetical protein T06_350 [Trichinella sp. T6]KRY17230.1 hypothetical protein T12_3631 [Trichinella patagoniensis]KRY34114.1 hypothetical protein T01_6472 [Trichinella spiralis]KRY54504.1 hypothetical protein T03_10082 [Trichinella britovi]KRZ53550.1 hypothetical protein T02_14732 [Trichinella nativa]KR